MTHVTTDDGSLLTDSAGSRVQFERDLSYPSESVWRAIITPDARACWFFSGTLEPQVGSTVALEDAGAGIIGRVTDLEPDKALVLDWSSKDAPTGAVEFRLEDRGLMQTGLRLTHHIDEQCHPINLLAGWHAILDDLAIYLSGAPIALCPDRHSTLLAHYRHRIDPLDIRVTDVI